MPGAEDKFAGFNAELPTAEEEQAAAAEEDNQTTSQARRAISGPAMGAALDDEDPDANPFDRRDGMAKTIAEREDDYHAQRRQRILSPARADPFSDKTPASPPAQPTSARARPRAPVARIRF